MVGTSGVKRTAIGSVVALVLALVLGWFAPPVSAALPGPAAPSVTTSGTLAVQVGWQSVAGLPSSARVLWWELRWRKAGTSTPAGTRTVGSSARSSTVGGLAPRVTYGFAVRAWTTAGTTPWSPDGVIAPVSPPPPVLAVTAGIGAADGTLEVRWTPAPPAPSAPVDHYEVSAQGAGSSVATVLDRTIAPDRTSYTATLAPGRQYTLSVRAVGPTGASAPKTAVAFLPKTTLPVVRIDTDGGVPIGSKEDYVGGRVSTTPNAGGPATDAYSGTTEVRGHGNSTWGRPKKPYRLKLSKAAGLFGLPSSKHWVLLANYIDRSNLRNAVAFRLGSQTSLAWTPRTRFVELVVNGKYLGLYQLAEHVRLDKNRINVDALKPEDTTGDALTGGYHIELEQRLDLAAAPGFVTPLGNRFELKDPEEPAPEQSAYISGYVAAFERSLMSPAFTAPATGYGNYIDLESFIDWYLVEEALKNNDAWFSSAHFVKPRLGKLQAGPLWDFDQSAGMPTPNRAQTPDGWGLRRNSRWFGRLHDDPAFRAAVKARWIELRDEIDALAPFIDQQAAAIGQAALLDQQIWRLPNTFGREVNNVKRFIAARARWIDAQYGIPAMTTTAAARR